MVIKLIQKKKKNALLYARISQNECWNEEMGRDVL